MSSATIRAAIDGLLTTSQSSLISIAWEGVSYFPDQSTPYLGVRMSAMSRRPTGPGVNTVNEWSGKYQVSVWYPVGAGMQAVLTKVDELLAQFSRGTSVVTTDGLTVTFNTPTPTPAIQEGNWVHVPVILPWFAYE